MRIYEYKLNSGTLKVVVNDKGGTIESISAEGNDILLPEGSENEAVAAIALAVDKAVNEVVHDDEPDVITIQQEATAWNSPELHFNNIVKK